MQVQTSDEPMLSIRNLVKSYPGRLKPAVEGLTLDVAGGEIRGLVGLNGAGKTTVLRACAGLITPSAGLVKVCGFDVSTEKLKASRHLGLVQEFPNFNPGGKALAQLVYFAGYFGYRGRDATNHCSSLLMRVGLEGSANLRIGSFSQGMKKRFALAAALLGDPKVLLLDEVLNGLDPQGVVMVRNLMSDLRDEGKAILLSSHNLSVVEQVADNVTILHKGRLVTTLAKKDLQEGHSGDLRITLKQVDQAALDFLGGFGSVRRKGDVVWVSGIKSEPDEINAALVTRGYRVRDLSFVSSSLEELFFDLIDVENDGTKEAEEDL